MIGLHCRIEPVTVIVTDAVTDAAVAVVSMMSRWAKLVED